MFHTQAIMGVREFVTYNGEAVRLNQKCVTQE